MNSASASRPSGSKVFQTHQSDLFSMSPEQSAVKHAVKLEKGLFISFEGGEGAGKTTQATRLSGRMTGLGIPVEMTREPGGTRLGEEIRRWVKREPGTTAVAETLLFNAARAQLVTDVIRPRLRRGAVVIVDRFTDSTVAYQGYGRGLHVEQIKMINHAATGGLEPDLTIFLDADPRALLGRVDFAPSLFKESSNGGTTRQGDNENERRFEREPLSFHEKVREGFRELAKEGGRWSVIRADQAQHRVADAIWKRVRPLLVERGVDPQILVRRQSVRTDE